MIPDLTFVKDTFNRFNAVIFGSSLPVPGLVMTRARTFRGKMAWTTHSRFGVRRCRDFEMRISVLFDLPAEEWEDVVIHEMIHYHIAYRNLRDTSSHGPVFRRLMHEINSRHGRHITVSARSTDAQRGADRQVRAHYLCMARFSDGRLGVAPVAKTRIFDLWDAFPAIPGVVSVKWAGVTDPWFNRFPRVMKPKLYLSSADELLPHLKGGMPLCREGGVIKVVSRRCFPDELLP